MKTVTIVITGPNRKINSIKNQIIQISRAEGIIPRITNEVTIQNPNSKLEKSLLESQQGKTTKVKNFKALRKQMFV